MGYTGERINTDPRKPEAKATLNSTPRGFFEWNARRHEIHGEEKKRRVRQISKVTDTLPSVSNWRSVLDPELL